MSSPIVVAVVNQKGGVGKTTTAVNLAASIASNAEDEARVLLVDMDPQGNASSGLGVAPRSVTRSIYDALIGRARLGDVVVQTAIERLRIAPATQDLVAAEIELIDEPDRAQRLGQVLVEGASNYDYIFVDCPPSLGLLTLNALVAAQRVLVPLQCEYYALEGLTYLMDTLDRVRRGPNASLELDGIVLTMFDPRNNLAHQVADEVKKHFHVYESIVPRNVRLSEAPSHGKPILLYDARSKGSEAYVQLAEEMLDRWNAGEASVTTKAGKRSDAGQEGVAVARPAKRVAGEKRS